jgi:putative methionine-R-sulfoxide reductase with GAF domain
LQHSKRPLNKIEKGLNCPVVWEFEDQRLIELDEQGREPTGKTYSYDLVFNPSQDTLHVYDKQCRPIVESAMKGYNGTVFAYGQTSSGKTWTLMGDGHGGSNPGVTILAIKDIFQYVKDHPSVEWNITCCYMEIYNETITDLLQPDRKKAYNLPIMEDKVFGPMPKGIMTVGVHDTKHCLDVLASGEKNRSFAATDMNANSSRSHTLFRLRIQGKTASAKADQMKENMNKVANSLYGTQAELGADRCSLFLLDHKTKEMFIQAGDITLRLPIGAGIAGTVAKTGETINIEDAYEDSRFNRGVDTKTGYRTKSILCMAVKGTKKIVGVVQYINKKEGDFTDDDVKKVQAMIDTLGPLIEVTQLMAKVQTTSGLNLVDLAGSERADKTGAKGAQLKEGANINKSLMMLGRCIQMLSSGSKGHVPFRNSKLTRLLSTSLGGNAKTAIMCAFSPASRNRAETISTFQFASRAKTIVNVAKCNQKKESAALSKAYEEEIRKLKEQMEKGQVAGMTEEEKAKHEEEKRKQAEQHDKEMEYLKEQQQEMQNKADAEAEKLIKKHEAAAEKLRLEHEAEQEKARLEHEAHAQKLREEAEKLKLEHEAEQQKHQEEQERIRLEHEAHAKKLKEESMKMDEQLKLHRAESRRMSMEIRSVEEQTSKRIADLVARNSLHQVRSRKTMRDLKSKETELDEAHNEIEKLKLQMNEMIEQHDSVVRKYRQEISNKDDELLEQEKKSRQDLMAKDKQCEALQATIDSLNAKCLLQDESLSEARKNADEANKNSLLTTGLVTNLERELDTLKSGIKAYRDFFVEWQKKSKA